MKFFFDNCISKNLVGALRLITGPRYTLVHLSEKFPRDSIQDPDWLSELGKEGNWFVISGDPRITRAKVEKEAWKESRLTAFFFKDGFVNMTSYEQAAFLFRRWPDIVVAAKQAPQGAGYFVHLKGEKIETVYGI